MAGLREEIKNGFRQGDMLTKLILINLAVYIAFVLIKIVSFLFRLPLNEFLVDWIALPSNLLTLATRPWTLVTYMFFHQDFFHILFNMLWLYFGGKLFLEYFGERSLLSTYLLGGLIGGLIYVLAYNIFPSFGEVLPSSNNRGASAGVMAIVIAIAAYNPRFPVQLFFMIRVPIWTVGALALLLDLVNLAEGKNPGGHLAHLGGAAFGYIMARRYQSGQNITEGFSEFLDSVVQRFKPKTRSRKHVKKVYVKRPSGGTSPSEKIVFDQQRMDEILDKIRVSGYESLTKEEKDYLFKIGQD